VVSILQDPMVLPVVATKVEFSHVMLAVDIYEKWKRFF
jgi:hypothetical protein